MNTTTGARARTACANPGWAEKGIPNAALAAYEVDFRNDRAHYKTTNTLVQSWTGGNKETLYVIDGRTNKIYMVNVDGRIQWITNDSGHCKPSQENLKQSIAAFKAAGFQYFPPRGDCTYDFKPVAGKEGVVRQAASAATHCEL